MLNIDEEIIKTAYKTAMKSDQIRTKMSAIVMSNSKIKIPIRFLRAFNYNVHNEMQGEKKLSIHAEESLITKAASMGVSLSGSTILIYRYMSSKNSAGISKPCHRCSELLKKANVRYVIYNDGEEWIRKKVKEL